MIDALMAAAPTSLAAATAMVTVASPGPRSWTLADLRSGALTAAMGRFFDGAFAACDRRAVTSLWSMYFLGGLVIPTTVALLRLDRVLPVEIDTIAFDLDAAGRIERFRLPHGGSPGRDGSRFDALVHGHLSLLIAILASQTGLSPRVLWSNAAVILDYAVDELVGGGDLHGAALAEARSVLAGTGSPCFGITRPFTCSPNDPATRRRATCCLRYKLPGVGACPAICPIACRLDPGPGPDLSRHPAGGRHECDTLEDDRRSSAA